MGVERYSSTYFCKIYFQSKIGSEEIMPKSRDYYHSVNEPELLLLIKINRRKHAVILR